jgi:5-(carboxyamino)imidazole ribonucleotide synthase
MSALAILPGATLGLLGGGQLGRYFTVAARVAGYRVWVLDPDPAAPAAQFADRHLCAGYDDPDALALIGRHCAAITTEFENAPASALQRLADEFRRPVRPSAGAVAIAQDRIREKQFLSGIGIPVGPWQAVRGPEALEAALAATTWPAILKTARFGYDGKGQVRVADAAAARTAVAADPSLLPCVIETRLDLAREISVVLGRAVDGTVRCFPVAENRHRDGILDVTIVPARITPELALQAQDLAGRVAQQLDYVGVLAVEFFLLHDGRLLVNEMAPRPHNSGHFTIDAGACSQFEQQLRLICGFPPLDPHPAAAAVMVNLLGDIWGDGQPDWSALLAEPRARLHLYGKEHARPGRKMGHFTLVGGDLDQILSRALALRGALDISDD